LTIFLVFLLILGGIAFWGYRQVTKVLSSEDLGVTYSAQDYEDLIQEIGIDVEAEKLCLDCEPLTFTDPHEVGVNISNAQASAAFDIINESLTFASVSNTQIRFSDDMGELSTILTYQGRNYPVYISGNIAKSSGTTISGEIFDLKAGGFNIPSGVKNMVEEGLVQLANDRMATMGDTFSGDTFSIDEVNLTDDGLDFKGTVPANAQ